MKEIIYTIKMKVTVVIDEEEVFLQTLKDLPESFNGIDLKVAVLKTTVLFPKLNEQSVDDDILLIDIDVVEVNSAEVIKTIKNSYPFIKIAALGSDGNDFKIIRSLREGCCAYLYKDIHVLELKKALTEIYQLGYYNADSINIFKRRVIKITLGPPFELVLHERERIVLQLLCSEMTDVQIAAELQLAERTLEGYKSVLFNKLNVGSRVGLVLEAIRLNLVEFEPELTQICC